MKKILLGTAMAAFCAGAALAQPAVITIVDRDVFPESVTALKDGTVIVGSMLQQYIYRAAPGSARAERWISLTSLGSASWGVFADEKNNTLYACTAAYPMPAKVTPPIKERHTVMRAFDLRSGAPKGAWPLLGATNSCNDITVGPDNMVYVSDIANGNIQRLRPGGTALEPWAQTPELTSVDGISFNGATLYANNVSTGKLYRMPINADGSAGAPVEITLSQPLGGPDGMRFHNGKLYVAENRTNRVTEVTITGDHGTVRELGNGYVNATGVAPLDGVIWVQESKQNFWRDPALANTDPNPFVLKPIVMPK